MKKEAGESAANSNVERYKGIGEITVEEETVVTVFVASSGDHTLQWGECGEVLQGMGLSKSALTTIVDEQVKKWTV